MGDSQMKIKKIFEICTLVSGLLMSTLTYGSQSGFQFSADSIIQPSEFEAATNIVKIIQERTNASCKIISTNGTQLEFLCKFSKNNEFILSIETEYHKPGIRGILIKTSTDLKKYLTQASIIKMMNGLALIGLKYMQGIDSRTSWDGNIMKDSFGLFSDDPDSIMSIYNHPDQTSASFIELSVKKGLGIFLGFIG
jgi:hypothetical protein